MIYNPEMECMSRDERTALQSERLVKTVRHEYDNVPFYRQRMDEKGVKSEDIKTLKDIQLLPFMMKMQKNLMNLILSLTIVMNGNKNLKKD